MLFLFRKKAYPKDDIWTISTGILNKKQTTIRRSRSASSLAGHAKYRHRLTVTVTMIDVLPTGLPTEGECDNIAELEVAVSCSLEADQDALHVLSVTQDGIRDLIFHTRKPGNVEAKLKSIQNHFPYRQIAWSVEIDRRWRVYRALAPNA